MMLPVHLPPRTELNKQRYDKMIRRGFVIPPSDGVSISVNLSPTWVFGQQLALLE